MRLKLISYEPFLYKFWIYLSFRTNLSFDSIDIESIGLAWMKAIPRVDKRISD